MSHRRARAAGALAAALLGACTDAPAPPPPDVLIVVLDTVRADRLSAWGYGRPTSRQLEAIAASGVRFADTMAPSPWTWPSHASLFTGLPPWEHGAHFAPGEAPAAGAPPGDPPPPLLPHAHLPTLAERFTAAGYRTVSVASNVWLDPSMGLTRGFTEAQATANDAETVAATAAALADPGDAPLLLFVNLFSAHSPYAVVPEVPWSAARAPEVTAGSPEVPDWARPYLHDTPGLNLQRSAGGGQTGEEAVEAGALVLDEPARALVGDLYDGGLVQLDAALLALVQAWNARGRGGGVLVVTSDHGESLGETDAFGQQHLGHGRALTPEVLQVPLVVAAPGRLPAGVVVERPVALAQVHDTVLELAGLAAGGRSLVGVVGAELGSADLEKRGEDPRGSADLEKRGGGPAASADPQKHGEGTPASTDPQKHGGGAPASTDPQKHGEATPASTDLENAEVLQAALWPRPWRAPVDPGATQAQRLARVGSTAVVEGAAPRGVTGWPEGPRASPLDAALAERLPDVSATGGAPAPAMPDAVLEGLKALGYVGE